MAQVVDKIYETNGGFLVLNDQALTINHGSPKQVELSEIESELDALDRDAVGKEVQRTFGRMLTLVVYSEVEEPPEKLDALVGEITVRASARAILVRRAPAQSGAGIQAHVSTHCLFRGEDEPDLCSEQITLTVHEDQSEQLKNSILSLRLRDLPLVLWWRARPDPTDRLFVELAKASDQVILDSARFATQAAELGKVVSELRRESDRVPFGDLNWARLAPWRELVAQFFDVPEHLDYLTRLDEMTLEYSSAENASPAQPVLISMWLATMLKWEVVAGSWQSKGRDRYIRLTCQGREIRVEIRGVTGAEAPPGSLTSIILSAKGEPPADFNISWCGETCVSTSVTIGGKTVERASAISVPDEVTLVCEEFDASRRDRVYHQALIVLEQMVA